MIKLSNGMEFECKTDAKDYISGMMVIRRHIKSLNEYSYLEPIIFGKQNAKSTAIVAINVAIENAELALKSAQQRKTKMKACKKATKPAAKKPAVKKAVKKPAAKKK